MKKEPEDLLLKDLCARLPYGVKCQFEDNTRITDGESGPFYDYTLSAHHLGIFMRNNNFHIKPYLRPMSSMTEEETLMFDGLMMGTDNVPYMVDVIDWLDKNMFDYRGLIPKRQAFSTEVFNPYKD